MNSGQITAVHRDNKQRQRYHIDLDGSMRLRYMKTYW